MGEGAVDFRQIQLDFASHIRDPLGFPPPAGISPHRMAVYRDLFFNNIENFIATGFPVLKSLGEKIDWETLIRDFYAKHRCKTPLFIGIAEEFLAYLRDDRQETADPPFLLELAHYEWVELVLAVKEGEPPALRRHDIADLPDARVELSPVAWGLGYRFPVHCIGPDFMPKEPPLQPTCLVVYRDRQDVVRFMEVNSATYRLLEGVERNPHVTVRQHLMRVADELLNPDPASVLEFGTTLLLDLHKRGVLDLMA